MSKSYKIVPPGHVFPLAGAIVDGHPSGLVKAALENLTKEVGPLSIVVAADDNHVDRRLSYQPITISARPCANESKHRSISSWTVPAVVVRPRMSVL